MVWELLLQARLVGGDLPPSPDGPTRQSAKRAVKREYGGKPTKRERALAIKRLMDQLDVALSDIEAAS